MNIEHPTFKEAFLFWLKLGFISFGGPAGQIAIMHEFVVEKKRWISESKFLHALNYCMLLPGPEAQQLATYIGWLLHKTKGALSAGILFVLPSTFILLILSILYVKFGNVPVIYALFSGLKPAVVAIVIVALIKIAKKSLNNFFSYLISALSFISIYFFQIPFPAIIISAMAISLILNYFMPSLLSSKKNLENISYDESGYCINKNSVIAHSKITLKFIIIKFFIFALLWIIPLIFFMIFSNNIIFWREMILFFTKAAFITFGGAYSVLTYVAQVAVENYHWLSKLQMIDGLALGETTPGPLIMILSFIGFMAGYNHFGGSLIPGVLGLFTTTYYTFLPSFFFILAGAPLIEMTQHNERIKSVMNIVSAAVVGVILNLTVYVAIAVLFPEGITFSGINYFNLAWIIISFTALYFYKVNIIKWIGVSAIAGIAYYFLS